MPSVALAAEGAPADTPVHTLAVGAAFANGWIHGASVLRPYANDAVIQVGVAYRIAPRFTIGAVGSFSPGLENDHQLWRLSGEGRVLAVATRFVEVWGAGELGLAASKYVPNDFGVGDCIDPGGCATPSEERRFHLAPLVGTGAGIDFLPLRFASVGMEGRALLPYFVAHAAGSGPEGFSPIFTLGLTVSGRVPLD
jgi:hypothetical protein